jgi:hypothetical protein
LEELLTENAPKVKMRPCAQAGFTLADPDEAVVGGLYRAEYDAAIM